MNFGLPRALGLFAILLALASLTLEGKIRLATLVVILGMALKTWLADLRRKAEQAESAPVPKGLSEPTPKQGQRD